MATKKVQKKQPAKPKPVKDTAAKKEKPAKKEFETAQAWERGGSVTCAKDETPAAGHD